MGEVITVARLSNGRRIVIEVTPYLKGGGEVIAVVIGPRGGRAVIHYAAGGYSADRVREDIALRARVDAATRAALNSVGL